MVALITFVGCSKDDDNPNQGTGSIDEAVGTYKGAFSCLLLIKAFWLHSAFEVDLNN